MLLRFWTSLNATKAGILDRIFCINYLQNRIPLYSNFNFIWVSRMSLHQSVYKSKGVKPMVPRKEKIFDSKMVRSTYMVTELSKQGRIDDARKLFDEMCERDIVAWTGMIDGYIKCGMIDEARSLFDRADAKKNVITWTAMVGGYIRSKRIKDAERLFNEMPEKNVVSWNVMIDGYSRNGEVGLALDLFERMPERSVVSWNTIITALVHSGRIQEAQKLFGEMPKRDVFSWTTMVTGLSKNGRIEEARALFNRMPDRNVVSWNALITGYVQNNRLDEALELFEKMPDRDMPSWNTIITGFIQAGDLNRAKNLFSQMTEKNVITWTALMTGYIQHGQSEEALNCFIKMLTTDGVKPNTGTFLTILGACSDLAGLCEGQQIHQMISKTIYQRNSFVISALINMYSKCGELHVARKMFNDGSISQRDLISWNGMIAAYAHHGCGKEAISLFNEMQKLGFQANDVTYVALLSACSHSGLVQEGLKYFEELSRSESIQIRDDHFSCLIDLCGRAGQIKQAFYVISKLGSKASSSVWKALLSGCHVHGDMDVGKLAAKKVSEVDPQDAGNYLLLSNMLATEGKWKEAAKIRLKMKEKGLKKQPGCSWIEVGNAVHVFLVGDLSHSQSGLLRVLLRDLHEQMKKAGKMSENNSMSDEEFQWHYSVAMQS